MNEMIKKQLNHRTIRFFKDKQVAPEQLNTILEVINQTASSNALQAFSIIRVTDQEKRSKLAEITKQAYITKVPELFIFVIDNYRNATIAKAKGYQGESYRSMDFFFQGAADSYLAAQNATNAIEALGMGAVYFGSILNDAQAVVNLFNLPELTFPILGLGFGYPDDEPQLKPRMNLKLKLGENEYPKRDDIVVDLAAYDQQMQEYYDTRDKNRRVDSFTNQVVAKYQSAPKLRTELLRVVQRQGYQLNLE